MEFTKDVEDLPELRRVFLSYASSGKKPQTPLLWYYFLDEDNVTLWKTTNSSYNSVKIDGELTGVKGDAFRAVLSVPSMIVSKTRRIEPRPAEKPQIK